MYCLVISASGTSRMSRFWRRIRYSSRSSGPSKASRKTSSACGGMYRSLGIAVIGSPFTMANGISACSGASAAGAWSGSSLDATSLRSGFMRCRRLLSIVAQVHCAAHLVQRLASHFPRLVGTLGNDVAQLLGVLLELLRPLAHGSDFR